MPIPTSSLKKVLDALRVNDWTFETKETTTRVSDPDSPYVVRRGYSGRASRLPGKTVPAVEVTASNGTNTIARKTFTLTFLAENGGYLRANSTGSFDFMDTSLKDVLAKIERFSPAGIAARAAEQAAESQRQDDEEQAAVAAAYADAQAAEAETKAVALQYLKENFGLAESQSEQILAAATTAGTPLTNLFNASAARERVGRGWVPGKTSVRGVYADGVKVAD